MLDDLQLGEFIYEQPAVGDVEYTFKHALTQEVAYNSVLIERRKRCTSEPRQRWNRSIANGSTTISASSPTTTARSANIRKGGRIPAPGRPAGSAPPAHSEAIGRSEHRTPIAEKPTRGRGAAAREVGLQMTSRRLQPPLEVPLMTRWARRWRAPGISARSLATPGGSFACCWASGSSTNSRANGRTSSRLRNSSLRWPSVNPAPQGCYGRTPRLEKASNTKAGTVTPARISRKPSLSFPLLRSTRSFRLRIRALRPSTFSVMFFGALVFRTKLLSVAAKR